MPNIYNLSLKAKATDTGFQILAINAGVAKGHDIEFTPDVLKSSLSLWNDVPCMLDHPGFFEGPSVRDLAGALHDATWNEAEQGIQANLIASGPASDVIAALREAAKSDPAIMSTVGFSAVLRASVKSGGKVDRIHQIASVDCVINPARGGRFLQAIQPRSNAEMKIKIKRNGVEMEVEQAEIQSGDEFLSSDASLSVPPPAPPIPMPPRRH